MALIVTRRPYRELSDGTLRAQIDVEPNDKAAFLAMFPDSGDQMAVARIDPDVLKESLQEQMAESVPSYGEQARALKLSGFFRRPDVWKLIASDEHFLGWVKGHGKCVALSDLPCHGDIVAAHVRRVANGSGTGVKPQYSAVPLCARHHDVQHLQGESAVGGREHFDKQRIKTLEAWAWYALKHSLGFDSWSLIEPKILRDWAELREVDRYLPKEYKD